MSKINYSIIIPYKNSPDLLQRCIDSIPVRDDIQVIVVDDNSDKEKKASTFRSGMEVIYVDASSSKGAGRARNIGLTAAMGEWLLFADSDDFYEDNAFLIFDEYKDSDYQVVFLNSIFVENETLKRLQKYPAFLSVDEYDGTQYALDKIKYVTRVPWAKMVRRDFQQKYNMQFEEAVIGNDIFFSYQVGYYGEKFAVDKRVVYVYTKNANSISNKKKNLASYKQLMITYAKIKRFMRFIGHREWSPSQFVFWGQILKYESFAMILRTLYLYVTTYKEIKKNEGEYVDYFKDGINKLK